MYNKVEDGGFCLPCVFFATEYRGQAPGVLVSRPMKNFQNALEQTEEHKKKDYHTTAVSRADDFQEIMAGKQIDIKSHVDHGRAERIAKNTRRVLSLIKTLMLCGRQDMPICGHRDSLKDVESNKDADHRGNFWALLHFRIDAGGAELEEHLVIAARNETYTCLTSYLLMSKTPEDSLSHSQTWVSAIDGVWCLSDFCMFCHPLWCNVLCRTQVLYLENKLELVTYSFQHVSFCCQARPRTI